MKIELTHTYGKHVDDLVAQYVMGWKLVRHGFVGVYPNDPRPEFNKHPETEEQKILDNWWRKHGSDYSTVGEYWISLDDGFVKKADRWFPSTDMEQAYKALRMALRTIPQSDVHIEHLAGTGWCCSTCFDEGPDGERKWKAFKSFDTLPQAMCALAISWCKPDDVEIVWPKAVVIPDEE